jgi:hypothetical protein
LRFFKPQEYTADAVPTFTKFNNNGEAVMTDNGLVSKEATPTVDEALVMKIVAISWGAFTQGAVIPVNGSAYDKAVAIALPNLRERLSRPPDFSDTEIEAALFCSRKAGKEARKIAKDEAKNGYDPVVVGTTYEKAWKKVKDDVEKKNKRRKDNGDPSIEAVYC